MRIPTRKSAEDKRKLSGAPDVYITEAKLGRWKRELARLQGVEKRPAAEEVARTQAMGDLSENAAYQDAKWRLRRINSRILSLTEMIKNAIVINPGANPDGSVAIGSTVTLESNGQESTFTILGTAESNPTKGLISHSSPLGSALVDKFPGDVVEVNNREYKIIEVK